MKRKLVIGPNFANPFALSALLLDLGSHLDLDLVEQRKGRNVKKRDVGLHFRDFIAMFKFS